MTINHEKKLIFIHIPKNAGTSIIDAIAKKPEDIFMDNVLVEYKKHYKDYWDTYTKFSVIRDPTDRFISSYKFSRMNENFWFSSNSKSKKHPHYDICTSMNINEYVKYLYDNPKKLKENGWLIPQSFIISNEKNQIEVDFFVRYENLLSDLKKINIYNLKKINSSKIEDLSLINLTKKSKILLSQIYDIDYKNFKYQKHLSYQYL
jgi:hypothetical protein